MTQDLSSIIVILGAASLIGLGLLAPMDVAAAGGRAAIETAITLSSLVTAALLARRVSHARQLQDRMLLGAMVVLSVTDFVFYAVPALVGSEAMEPATGASQASAMLVAGAFAAIAFAPSDNAGRRRRVALCAGLAAIGALAARYPVALAFNVLAAAILVVSGIGFLTRAGRDRRQGVLLAGASFALAGARLQYLVLPAVAADGVTPSSAMRLVAYGLLLAVALRLHATTRRELAEAALRAERHRIARDLHDGLAQDLAFIAAYGQRLQADLGPDHPLIVAASRALACSRGVLVDLSASTAPCTATALRRVASELAGRFDVVVNVRVEQDGLPTDEPGLDASDREQIVRIAREAIVNAVRHGGARRVDIVLEGRGAQLRLCVSDDGCGISEKGLHKGHGFGLLTMRARADALGGRLTARSSVNGGTELEVVIPGTRNARRVRQFFPSVRRLDEDHSDGHRHGLRVGREQVP